MRFRRIQVERFGCLSEVDTGSSPLPSLVVVQGPNEAGKTSLFRFLTALLYGFYPASRDRNPYTPWSGGEIEGRAVLILEDGTEWTVHRRLLSSGWGRLSRNGRVEDIRNRTLPCADHVSLDLFQEVYALTLADLATLHGESWSQVQDRLVGALGATDLHSAREVWRELESEADGLWRPDRRGKPRARELAAKLRRLRERKQEATARDRELRQMSRTLRGARRDLEEARLRRSEVKQRLERIRTLLPVRRQLLRVEELREEAGPQEVLDTLPPDPGERIEELRAQVEEARRELEELDQRVRDEEDRARAPDEAERGLLEAQEEVRRLVARAATVEQAETRRSGLEQQLRDKERRIESQARELFADDPEPGELAERMERVAVAPLRERIREYRRAREDRRTREAALRLVGTPGAARRIPWGPATLGVLGVILVVAGASGSGALVLGLGVGAVAVGLALLGLELARGDGAAARAEDPEAELRRARAAEEAAGVRARRLLDGLGLHPALLEDPTPEIVTGLERLLELLRDREERLRTLEEMEGEHREISARLEDLSRRLALDLPGEPGPAAHLLERALRRAESRADEARTAERELERLRRERAKLEERTGERRRRLESLEERLRKMGGGDLERGLETARRRLHSRDRARGIVEELRRRHPDLEELRERIREADRSGESWTVEDDAVARARAAEEALTDRVEALERRVAGLEKEIEHLRDRETPDRVESEIRGVRDEMERVTRERDRKYVLARLIREADRRFREAHQPDLVRRAARHLEAITGGRYRSLSLGERDGGETFFLEGPDYPGPLPVEEPVSTGTREQVYLALRLAIVDHLDRRAETLPVFIDEAFVNWDPERRERGLDLLERISGSRQIFVFTCHPELGRELEARGGRLLRLPGT